MTPVKATRKLCLAATGFWAFLSVAQAEAPAIEVYLNNQTMGERTSDTIYLNFVGGGGATVDSGTGTVSFNSSTSIGYYYNSSGVKTDLYTNSTLNLTDLYSSSGTADPRIYVTSWESGRFYVSYDAGFTGLSDSYTPTSGPYPGWQPAPTSETVDPNFETRHQFWELTVAPTVVDNGGVYSFSNTNQVWADLSYIDYTSIALGMQVQNANSTVKNPTQTSSNTSTMLAAVGQTTTPSSQYEPDSNYVTHTTYESGSGTEDLYQIPGKATDNSYSTTTQFDAPSSDLSNFLRVSGPGSMPSTGSSTGPTAFYQSWTPYLTYMETYSTNTSVTHIKGTYATKVNGVDTAVPYDLTTTFSADTINIAGTDYTGYVLMEGTYNGESVTIVIPYSELLKSTGLYGANTGYSVDGAAVIDSPGNDQYTWMVGDLLAGMNYGFVGSDVDNPIDGTSGTTIGEMASSDWWQLGGYGDVYLYEGAQPDETYYNTYAAALDDVTTGYGFAYGDRLGDNTTYYSVTDGDGDTIYLQVNILPDFANVPEPRTAVLMALGVLIALGVVRRRRCS